MIFENGELLKMSELWALFVSFFKVGLFTFGGGAAMLPLLQAEFAEKRKWITEDELMDFYSIGQCTPGIIALNTATFIGYKRYKTAGAVVATTGIVMPSLIIITLVASVLQNFMTNEYVVHAFAGIRAVVVALILDAVAKLWKRGVQGRFGITVFAASLGVLLVFKLSPITVVIAAAATGYIYQKARAR